MKFCLVSDSHDNRVYLKSAIVDAQARGAEVVLHAGDIVAPSTLKTVTDLDLPLHVIHGNNTGDLVAMQRLASRATNRLHYYGQDAGIELAGKRLFIVHYPHYARAMATTGEWDIVCHGHDHKACISAVDNILGQKTWILDPGSVAGLDGPATYILGDLNTMQFELINVPVAE